MISPFNVFRVEKAGESKWLEPADSLTGAQARVAKLGSEHPGEYLLSQLVAATGKSSW
jgi:hypothetical protein